MKLSEINIYPIKSLKGISLASARVEDRGLQHDRRWMLVDDKNRFLTQREFPKMATISVKVNDGSLTAECEGSTCSIPAEAASGLERVTVWKSRVEAAVYGDDVNDFFSNALGADVKLVTMTDTRRPVNYWYRVNKSDHVSFADAFPFLLIGEGSLAELNRRIGEKYGDAVAPFPMNRFRPNFVVQGSEPFAEDTWKTIRIGSTVFRLMKPCARCLIPTIDQETGQKNGGEPIKTLSTFRTFKRAGKNKVLFGQNLIAVEAGGMISIGDEVEVLEFK